MTMLRSAIETGADDRLDHRGVGGDREAISDGLFSSKKRGRAGACCRGRRRGRRPPRAARASTRNSAGGGERQHDDDEQQIVENRLDVGALRAEALVDDAAEAVGDRRGGAGREQQGNDGGGDRLVADRPAPDHAQIADLLQRCGLGAGGRHGRGSGGPAQWRGAAPSATPSRSGAFAVRCNHCPTGRLISWTNPRRLP